MLSTGDVAYIFHTIRREKNSIKEDTRTENLRYVDLICGLTDEFDLTV